MLVSNVNMHTGNAGTRIFMSIGSLSDVLKVLKIVH